MTTAPPGNNVLHGRHPTPNVTADVGSSKKRQGNVIEKRAATLTLFSSNDVAKE
jgi:hypothetical protein